MPLKKGIKQLLAEAGHKAPSISVADAQKKQGDANTVFVDIRDVRELEREGMIPGAFHAPRGMLEFWVDPESPYYKPVFTEGKTYVLYCQADWRGTMTWQRSCCPDRDWKFSIAPPPPAPGIHGRTAPRTSGGPRRTPKTKTKGKKKGRRRAGGRNYTVAKRVG